MVDFYERIMLSILEFERKSVNEDAANDPCWDTLTPKLADASSSRSQSPENDVDDILESLYTDRYCADVTLNRLFSLDSEKFTFEVISGAAYLSHYVWPPCELVRKASSEFPCGVIQRSTAVSPMSQADKDSVVWVSSGVVQNTLTGAPVSERNRDPVALDKDVGNRRRLCVVETFLEDPAMHRSWDHEKPMNLETKEKTSRRSINTTILSSEESSRASPLLLQNRFPPPHLLQHKVSQSSSTHLSTECSALPPCHHLPKWSSFVSPRHSPEGQSWPSPHLPPIGPSSHPSPCLYALTNTTSSLDSTPAPRCDIWQTSESKEFVFNDRGHCYDFRRVSQQPHISNRLHNQVASDVLKETNNSSSELHKTCSLSSTDVHSYIANRVDVESEKLVNELMIAEDIIDKNNVCTTPCSMNEFNDQITSSRCTRCVRSLVHAPTSVTISKSIADEAYAALQMKNLINASDVTQTTTAVSLNADIDDIKNNESSCQFSNLPTSADYSKRLKTCYSDCNDTSHRVTMDMNERSLHDDVDVDQHQSFKFGLRPNSSYVEAKHESLRRTSWLFGSMGSLRSSSAGSSEYGNYLDDVSVEEIFECALENIGDNDGNHSSFSTLSQGRHHEDVSQFFTPQTYTFHKLVDDSATGHLHRPKFSFHDVTTAMPNSTNSNSHFFVSKSSIANAQVTSMSNAIRCSRVFPTVLYSLSASKPMSSYVTTSSSSCITSFSSRTFTSVQPSYISVNPLASTIQSSYKTTIGGLPIAIVIPSVITSHARQVISPPQLSNSQCKSFFPSKCFLNHHNVLVSESSKFSPGPPSGSQDSSGYFTSVSQICSDNWSRTSSCEANIDDDEDDPRLSGIESISDLFMDARSDIFETTDGRSVTRSGLSAEHDPVNLGASIINRNKERNGEENMSGDGVTDEWISSICEMSCFVSSHSHEITEGKIIEDTDVRSYCSGLDLPGLDFPSRRSWQPDEFERAPDTDYHDGDDCDSLSTVTSSPDSDMVNGSDVDPSDACLNPDDIHSQSFPSTSQPVQLYIDERIINHNMIRNEIMSDDLFCAPKRWSYGEKSSKLYIYEYADDGDTTTSDVIVGDISDVSDVNVNPADALINSVSSALNVNGGEDRNISGHCQQSGTTRSHTNTHVNNSENKSSQSRTHACSRRAMLQTDKFLLRLSEFRILDTDALTSESTDCLLSTLATTSTNCDVFSTASPGQDFTVSNAASDRRNCVLSSSATSTSSEGF